MKSSTVEERVIKVVAEVLVADKSKILRDNTIEGDLNADSLAIMELKMELEEEFQIEFSDAEAEKVFEFEESTLRRLRGEESNSTLTVGKIIDFIKEQLEKVPA